ncbi:MAG: hypothetical protein KKB51_00430 [Candidatus Riflebacteria bacterium]|nr:hypothetical protein [Candidatus Riflebacteria bacterium]
MTVSGKSGFVGIIVVVLVLGILMTVSTSNTLMIQTESLGEKARSNYKQANYAAIAGIHFVISRLRANADPTWTTASRLYFTFDANCTTAHHYKKIAGSNVDVSYSGYTPNVKGKETFASDHIFANTVDTNADPTNCRFTLCTYPGVTPAVDYWVKSQGSFVDSANVYRSQVWALLEIDNTTKTVTLKKWGNMAVQPTGSVTGGLSINDFWDWQDEFY